jgi:hypothetical protein
MAPTPKERWNDPDELVLLLEAYLDVRDASGELTAIAVSLAAELKRNPTTLETMIQTFASKDKQAPKGKSKWTLSPLAKHIWDAYGQEPAEVRRLAVQIRTVRGRGLDKSNNHVTPPLWR